MPKFTKKNVRGTWRLAEMQAAVRDVLMYKRSQRYASTMHNVPRQTLRRHLQKVQSGEGVVKTLGRKTVLSETQEEDLKEVILDMESKLFGLTRNDVRHFVYTFCQKNKIVHPFNNASEMAGKDWLAGFLKRHSELSLRVPEATSIQRAIGFNKAKVDIFMDHLERTLFDRSGKRIIPAGDIYNVDESGFTICHKPRKILAKKGKHGVGVLSSAERGKNVTVVACVSATGVYIPPMFVFPRVRMRPELLDGAPPGSIGRSNKSGWINEELFLQWFDHFLAAVQPLHRPNPVLLILDGHSSHTKNLELIEKARTNNVIMLSLPSHCTHKLQPLDVAVFKAVNVFYNQEVQTWLREHPGRPVTEFQIASLFRSAYEKAATLKNALSGFRKTGINPFNRHIFSEEDYVAAAVTDVPAPCPQANPQPPMDTGTAPESQANPQPPIDTGTAPESQANPQPPMDTGTAPESQAHPQPPIDTGTAPESQAHPQPPIDTGTAPESQAHPQPPMDTGTAPESQAHPQPPIDTGTAPESQAHPQPPIDTGTAPESQAHPQPPIDTGTAPESQAHPQPPMDTGTAPESQANPQPPMDTGTAPESQANPQPPIDTGTAPESQANPQPPMDTGTAPESQAHPQPPIDTGTAPESQAHPQPPIDTGTAPESQAHPQPPIDTGTAPESQANPQPPMDTGTAPESQANPQPSTSATFVGISDAPHPSSSHDGDNGDSALEISFEEIIGIPKQASHRPAKKRKVAHSEILTSSPYKNNVEAAKKTITKAMKKKSNAKGKGKKSRNTQVMSKTQKVSAKRKKNEPEQSLSNDICGYCGVKFGCPEDPKSSDDWIQCKPCHTWFHESCGEECGIMDDDSFTCQKCV